MNTQSSQSGRQMLLRLIQAARSSPSAALDNADAVDYDWSTPHSFTPGQLEKLGEFISRSAQTIGHSLREFLRNDIVLEPAEMNPYFAAQLQAQQVEEDQFSVALVDPSGKQGGLIALTGQTVNAWVGKLLGGSKADLTSEREPSLVENALLLDVFRALNTGFQEASSTVGVSGFNLVETVYKGSYPLDKSYEGEYYQIPYLSSESDQTPIFSFILSGEVLGPITTGSDRPAIRTRPENNRKIILENLKQADLIARVSLGQVPVTMQDLVSLEPGDVMLINKQVGEPIDLLVGEKVIRRGLPVRCGDNYAVQITNS